MFNRAGNLCGANAKSRLKVREFVKIFFQAV